MGDGGDGAAMGGGSHGAARTGAAATGAAFADVAAGACWSGGSDPSCTQPSRAAGCLATRSPARSSSLLQSVRVIAATTRRTDSPVCSPWLLYLFPRKALDGGPIMPSSTASDL